ncbi:hypothetical protein GGX14DRAFT_393943 [Mycena pura]|uniref:Uncharacterized protein n=1 Tax=Mycena pura TaxID=153505 RepID=A0AAD6VFK8_9AGAR|nr:hypothetical protein GGX14DRAFT_393943 [Mycena pura]
MWCKSRTQRLLTPLAAHVTQHRGQTHFPGRIGSKRSIAVLGLAPTRELRAEQWSIIGHMYFLMGSIAASGWHIPFHFYAFWTAVEQGGVNGRKSDTGWGRGGGPEEGLKNFPTYISNTPLIVFGGLVIASRCSRKPFAVSCKCERSNVHICNHVLICRGNLLSTFCVARYAQKQEEENGSSPCTRTTSQQASEVSSSQTIRGSLRGNAVQEEEKCDPPAGSQALVIQCTQTNCETRWVSTILTVLHLTVLCHPKIGSVKLAKLNVLINTQSGDMHHCATLIEVTGKRDRTPLAAPSEIKI